MREGGGKYRNERETFKKWPIVILGAKQRGDWKISMLEIADIFFKLLFVFKLISL